LDLLNPDPLEYPEPVKGPQLTGLCF